MQLTSTTALITGAAGGLGEATARQLAAAGAFPILVDRQKDKLEQVAKDIGGRALVVDLTDVSAVEAGIEAALSEAPHPLRTVVNCAGIGTAGRILPRDGELTVESFSQTLAVNLIGTYTVMNVTARHMAQLAPVAEDGERGVVINTASVAVEDGQIGQAAYAASKGGIASMTLPAAREFARFGIRVVAIAPGLFETPMTEGLPDDVRADIIKNIPFPHRLGRAAEYAELAEHVVRNVMLNGVVIRLDGAVRLPIK